METVQQHEWDNKKCVHCGAIYQSTEVDEFGHSVEEYFLNGRWTLEEPPCITDKYKIMKTVKIKMKANWGFMNMERDTTDEFEIGDNATEEQIQEMANERAFEWASQYIDSWSEIISVNDKSDEANT